MPRILHTILLPAFLSAIFTACTVGTNDPGDASVADPDARAPIADSIALAPADVVLESVDGATPSQAFAINARTADGYPVEVSDVRWALSHDRVGGIDEDGTFTATGQAGGTVDVIAMVDAGDRVLTATARVTVQLDVTLDAPPSLVDDVEGRTETESPFEAVTPLYPFDGAHMPNNVGPPDLQWHPIGAEGDAFRVVMETAHASVRGYLVHTGADFGSHLAIDPAAFRVLADSARGAHVTLRVDRAPVGSDALILGHPVTVFLSEDGLYGTLYYWQVRARPRQSDVFRIDAATSARESVFEIGAGQCVGCHTLSQDGRRLSATVGGLEGWATSVVDAASATAPPPALLGPFVPAYHTMAWSPNGDRVLASRPLATDRNDTRLFLLDGDDGTEEAALNLPGGVAGYPTWSPNGALVAWMEGGGDGPNGTEAPTKIALADVSELGFGTPRVLHDGADLEASPEGGVTDSHPTFSPDSRFVVFAHGTSSVSTPVDGAPEPRSGLYIVSVDGGAPIRLDEGMGPEGPVDAFWPVFSPFVTEEADGSVLYWLAFYSRQDYGNAEVGTGGTRRRQLWLMAIDPARAAEGLDPSHPPYWLPGQDTSAEDIAAHWAPTACRARGESCAASSECCSGECAAADPSQPDVLTCQPPRSCRTAGQSCENEDDCCDGLGCNLNVCGYAPPE